jgi:hypothetical protein
MLRVLFWAYSLMPQGVEHLIVYVALQCFTTVSSIDALRRCNIYYKHCEYRKLVLSF